MIYKKITEGTGTQAEKDNAQRKAQSLQLSNDLQSAQAALGHRSNFLAGKTTGYLGEFAARGGVHSNGTSSWADEPAAEVIASIAVTNFDLAKCLETTSTFDGDIDGKYSSTGSSTVKEGEERFVIGASYLGTRGVSITEVSGLLGSFVHGKRVTWTDGDIWVRQKQGKMYKTDLETNSFDYQLKTEEKISIDRPTGRRKH